MSSADLLARVTGDDMSAAGAEVARRYSRPEPGTGQDGATRSRRPASTGRLLRALRRPWEAHPGTLVAAVVPEGRTPLTPMIEGLDDVFGGAWPAAPTWLVALRLDTGQRVPFGRAGTPHTGVGRAVAASCAVPGVFAPVEVEFDRYVDGGLVSPTNADVLEDESLDLAVVVAPTAARTGAGMRPDTPVRHIMRAVVDAEARRLARAGIPTYVIQPGRDDLDAMGINPMDLGRMDSVARAALDSTATHLAEPAQAERLCVLRTATARRQ